MGSFHAQAPGGGSHDVSHSGECDDDDEARAQPFDAFVDLTETGAIYEIDEEGYAGGREDNSDGSKFVFRAWRFIHLAGKLIFDCDIRARFVPCLSGRRSRSRLFIQTRPAG
jgi:hypothetical protein